MLLKRNLLESLTIISCSGSIICILLNYVTNISPITGVWFPIYILTLFILSVSLSIKFIQWLLHLNKPIKYDLDDWVNNYPQLSFLLQILPQPRKKEFEECKEYDTNELSVISTVLERKLVSSWYVPYISEEIGFPFACKQMLDQMIGRTFQICNKIEPKEVYVDTCSILITHLKEYRKAVKRHEKSPETPIQSHYKRTHLISNNPDKNYQPAEHCTNVLRVILKELVPWELWDTPHSELLVRILSKKLDNYIDNTLADPQWLNDKLLSIIKGKEEMDIKNELVEELKEKPKEDVTEVPTEKVTDLEMPTVEAALSTVITKSVAPILPRALEDDMPAEVIEDTIEDIAEEATAATEPVEIQSSPVLRQRRGRQGRNEVKIYDRIIEGSVKTWETDIDLQCISLGQDLLASLNGEITLSRLWGQDSDVDPGRMDQRQLWFGEEDNIEDVTESKEPSPVRKELSPKPAEILKELQTTVHQAKTKIGDLQVPNNVLDVPRNSNDEAAGMMEGLLDFGIAGFKKGLRFTGLSDDSQDKSPSHQKEKPDKTSPPAESRNKTPEPKEKEVIFSSVIQREDNGSTIPPLVKQQRVSSQDSLPSQPKPILRQIPPPLLPPPDSPEPEYEEAADLSTSIAKLRCLLQQRAESGNSSRSGQEDIWWESAEETRGRTQHHHSSRPVDTATLADEYDMQVERNSSPGQTSINMQRLDRLFQRTVTGVFNSIKTAVGAEGEADGTSLLDWTYVCTSVELSVGGAVARLVGSRRAYSHVDAALDTLAQLPPPPPAPVLAPLDLEEWCVLCGGGWTAGAELLVASGVCSSHVSFRLATLLLADLAESLIDGYLEELTAWLRKQVFVLFEDMASEQVAREKRLRRLDLQETCHAVMEKIPATYLFGEDTLSDAVTLIISSFSHEEVNKEVIFKILDLFAVHFKKSAGLRNPSFDSNC